MVGSRKFDLKQMPIDWSVDLNVRETDFLLTNTKEILN